MDNPSPTTLAAQANISLTMIVRNEERVLTECLESVKGMFTQIVVVDTGSNDRTIAIAREYGAEIYEITWPDSFAAARNGALSHATGKWVCWMDADETMPQESIEPILNAAINAPEDVVGFFIPTHFVGGDGTKVDRIKLFRNLPGLKWKYRLHEQIYDALRDKGRLEHLQAHVLHSGYDWTPAGQVKKKTRNERLLKLELQDSPNNPLILFHLGSEAHLHGQNVEAIRWLEQSIPRIPIGASYAVKAFSTLAGAKSGLGDEQGALAICEVALKLFPNDAELRFRTGQSLAALGRFKEAKEQFLLVKQCPPDYLSGIDSFILGPKCDHNLAMVCIRLGERQEAYSWLQKAVAAGFAPSAAIFCEYALDQNDFATAKRALDSLKEITGMDETWSALGAKLATASQIPGANA